MIEKKYHGNQPTDVPVEMDSFWNIECHFWISDFAASSSNWDQYAKNGNIIRFIFYCCTKLKSSKKDLKVDTYLACCKIIFTTPETTKLTTQSKYKYYKVAIEYNHETGNKDQVIIPRTKGYNHSSLCTWCSFFYFYVSLRCKQSSNKH